MRSHGLVLCPITFAVSPLDGFSVISGMTSIGLWTSLSVEPIWIVRIVDRCQKKSLCRQSIGAYRVELQANISEHSLECRFVLFVTKKMRISRFCNSWMASSCCSIFPLINGSSKSIKWPLCFSFSLITFVHA